MLKFLHFFCDTYAEKADMFEEKIFAHLHKLISEHIKLIKR